MKLSLLYLPFLVIVGCASTEKINPEAQKVKVMKADPAASCDEKGPVDSTGWDRDPVAISNRFKNQAANMGANYIRLESTTREGFQRGTAFKCP